MFSWFYENTIKKFYFQFKKISKVKLVIFIHHLLPKYKGLNTHERVIKNKKKNFLVVQFIL